MIVLPPLESDCLDPDIRYKPCSTATAFARNHSWNSSHEDHPQAAPLVFRDGDRGRRMLGYSHMASTSIESPVSVHKLVCSSHTFPNGTSTKSSSWISPPMWHTQPSRRGSPQSSLSNEQIATLTSKRPVSASVNFTRMHKGASTFGRQQWARYSILSALRRHKTHIHAQIHVYLLMDS